MLSTGVHDAVVVERNEAFSQLWMEDDKDDCWGPESDPQILTIFLC